MNKRNLAHIQAIIKSLEAERVRLDKRRQPLEAALDAIDEQDAMLVNKLYAAHVLAGEGMPLILPAPEQGPALQDALAPILEGEKDALGPDGRGGVSLGADVNFRDYLAQQEAEAQGCSVADIAQVEADVLVLAKMYMDGQRQVTIKPVREAFQRAYPELNLNAMVGLVNSGEPFQIIRKEVR